MEKEYKHPKLRRKLIEIYKNSLTKRNDSYYHVAVCFALELYAGFADGVYNPRRLPLALICTSLDICEYLIHNVSRIPRGMRLYLERRYR